MPFEGGGAASLTVRPVGKAPLCAVDPSPRVCDIRGADPVCCARVEYDFVQQLNEATNHSRWHRNQVPRFSTTLGLRFAPGIRLVMKAIADFADETLRSRLRWLAAVCCVDSDCWRKRNNV